MKSLFIIKINLLYIHIKVTKGLLLISHRLKHQFFHQDPIPLQLLISILVLTTNFLEIEINKVLINSYKLIKKSIPYGINPIIRLKRSKSIINYIKIINLSLQTSFLQKISSIHWISLKFKTLNFNEAIITTFNRIHQ